MRRGEPELLRRVNGRISVQEGRGRGGGTWAWTEKREGCDGAETELGERRSGKRSAEGVAGAAARMGWRQWPWWTGGVRRRACRPIRNLRWTRGGEETKRLDPPA
jgi:hypothetical protein